MGERSLVGIVVHHESYETVAAAVRALLDCGVPEADLLVVDNSEDPARRPWLAASLRGVEVLFGQQATPRSARPRSPPEHEQAGRR